MNCIREHWVITRKTHKCFGCLRAFEAGSKMFSQTNAEDGRAYTLRQCETCHKHMNYFRMEEVTEGWMLDELNGSDQTPEQFSFEAMMGRATQSKGGGA